MTRAWLGLFLAAAPAAAWAAGTGSVSKGLPPLNAGGHDLTGKVGQAAGSPADAVNQAKSSLETCLAGASGSQSSSALNNCYSQFVQSMTQILGAPPTLPGNQPGAPTPGKTPDMRPNPGDGSLTGKPAAGGGPIETLIDTTTDPGPTEADNGGAPGAVLRDGASFNPGGAMAAYDRPSGASGAVGAVPPPPAARVRGSAVSTLDAQLAFRARQALNGGDPQDALKLATFAIGQNPQNADAYAVRASVFNADGRYQMAERDASEALKADPDNTAALDARAYALNMQHKHEQAKKDAERAIQLDPRDAQGWLNLAIAQEAMGNLEAAMHSYEMAVQIDPTLRPLYEEFLKRYGQRRGVLYALPHALGGSGAAGLGLAAFAALLLGLAAFKFRGKGTVLLTPIRPASTTTAAASGAAADGSLRTPPRPTGRNGGRLIAGNYEVRKTLGEGGMGVVYEAFDQALGRKVAIKEMRSEIAQSERDKERFLVEARLVAKFQHPNIVSIYAVLEEGGRAYLVFEHVQGQSLDKILDRHHRLEPEAALPLFHGVAAALDYSHSLRVIHRDLKPSNVMISEAGVVKVMDFGIAHEAKQTVSRLTNIEAWGTLAYMPPEQEMGQASKESDIYAFAVLAYETLAGRLPFQGPNYLAQKNNKSFVPISLARSGFPPSLDRVFDKALEPKIELRPRSAGELVAEFEAALRTPTA